MNNTFKTFILLAGLTVLLLLIGQALAGRQGLYFALFMALIMNFIGYWFSDKIALAMSGAQEVSVNEAPDLHQMVEKLAVQAGIPKPRVYIIPQDTPNAFATGRNPEHAAVAVTQGILRILRPEELEGVLAHELAHVRNRDILISSVAAVIAGAISYLATMAQWGAMFGMGRSDDDEGGGRRKHDRGSAHGHRRPHRRHADPDGHLPQPGVRRRCHRSQNRRRRPPSGQRPVKAGGVQQADPHAGKSGPGPDVHRESPFGGRIHAALQHPSAH